MCHTWKWISVDDRMPARDTTFHAVSVYVLILCNGDTEIAFYDFARHEWFVKHDGNRPIHLRVTHWQPLPSATADSRADSATDSVPPDGVSLDSPAYIPVNPPWPRRQRVRADIGEGGDYAIIPVLAEKSLVRALRKCMPARGISLIGSEMFAAYIGVYWPDVAAELPEPRPVEEIAESE